MSANNGAVKDRVQLAILAAESAGEPPPGRPVLARQLRTTQYQVRKALAQLAKERELATAGSNQGSPASTQPARKPTEPDQIIGDAGGPPDVDRVALATAGGLVARWWRRVKQRRWALIIIGIGAGFSVWSGWVGLGEMTGYGPVRPFPGIWDSLVINSAIVLPISVEAYGAYALRHWLAPVTRRKSARVYACVSAFASLVVGGAAQVAYHQLKASGYVRAPWPVVMLVALVPVVVLGLASILAYLVKTDVKAGDQA